MSFDEYMKPAAYKPNSWIGETVLMLTSDAWRRLVERDMQISVSPLHDHKVLIARAPGGHIEVPVLEPMVTLANPCAAVDNFVIAQKLPKAITITGVQPGDTDKLLHCVSDSFPGFGFLWLTEKLEADQNAHDTYPLRPLQTQITLRPVAPIKKCEYCRGSGIWEDGPFSICKQCAGTGLVTTSHWATLRELWPFYLNKHLDSIDRMLLGRQHAYAT